MNFNLKSKYKKEIIPKLIKKFNYNNINSIPKLDKISINTGLGLVAQNNNLLKLIAKNLSFITGQYPIITKAKKSISTFKIRAGYPIGLKITLRDSKMYNFFLKLTNLALPRIKDFKGLSIKKFDKFGVYNFGIKESSIFPEINFEDSKLIDFGFNITIQTTAKTKIESYFLLKELGFPFLYLKKN